MPQLGIYITEKNGESATGYKWYRALNDFDPALIR
jgi:hypothetical protein